MRTNLRNHGLALAVSILFNGVIQAQDHFAYAITDVKQNSGGWTVLRKVNLQTGIYSDAILNGVDAKSVAYDAITRGQIESDASTPQGNASLLPFSTGVAAIAYDRKNNRLYYTPMFIDQLRYIDLKTKKVYYLRDHSLTGLSTTHHEEANIVTRMVITPDGYGYAITNDANSFIRFSTGKTPAIEQLGALVDDPANGGLSIHNRCSSWGGDMVADDEGNLYLFTARNSVFKINIETKVATWLGPVKGLPSNFTINGIVVTDENKFLAGSQGYTMGWYLIDPKTWSTTEFKSPDGIYLTSDLANSNIFSTHKNSATEIATIPQLELPVSDKIQIYPNPVSVSNNEFKIQFNKVSAGNYTVALTDVTGKQVITQKITVTNDGEVQTINLKRNTAQGIYLVKVSDISNKSIFTQKLVVQ